MKFKIVHAIAWFLLAGILSAGMCQKSDDSQVKEAVETEKDNDKGNLHSDQDPQTGTDDSTSSDEPSNATIDESNPESQDLESADEPEPEIPMESENDSVEEESGYNLESEGEEP